MRLLQSRKKVTYSSNKAPQIIRGLAEEEETLNEKLVLPRHLKCRFAGVVWRMGLYLRHTRIGRGAEGDVGGQVGVEIPIKQTAIH